MKRKGVSPVIATVLLISLVVVIALIVFIWMWNFTEEGITKFDKNIQLVCDDVEFSASYSGGELQISNNGNVPIYKMKVQVDGEVSELEGAWESTGLNPGGGFTDEISFGNADKIVLIPVLQGMSDDGKEEHICKESQGKEVIL